MCVGFCAGSSTLRWSLWNLKTLCSWTASSRTCDRRKPCLKTAPSAVLFFTTRVRDPFRNSEIFSRTKPHSFCISTDLYEEKFVDCTFENVTFLHNKKGCHLDYEEDNDVLIYLVSFLGSLAVLPGNIISALFMDKIGRIKIIGELNR